MTNGRELLEKVKNARADQLPALYETFSQQAYLAARFADYYASAFEACLDLRARPHHTSQEIQEKINECNLTLKKIAEDIKKREQQYHAHNGSREYWAGEKSCWPPKKKKIIENHNKEVDAMNMCRGEIKKLDDKMISAKKRLLLLVQDRVLPEIIEADLEEKKNRANEEKLFFRELLLNCQRAMVEAGIQMDLDQEISIENYKTRWNPAAPPEVMLFEQRVVGESTRELQDFIRFLDPNRKKWELQMTGDGFVLYPEGNVLQPVKTDRFTYLCGKEAWTAAFQKDMFLHELKLTSGRRMHNSQNIHYLDWDGKEAWAHALRRGRLTWFVHEPNSGGTTHTSNLIFLQDWWGELQKLVIIDNIVYTHREHWSEQELSVWDNREKRFSVNYRTPQGENRNAVFLGNIAYHFPEAGLVWLDDMQNQELLWQEKKRLRENMVEDPNIHYITGNDWHFKSTVMPSLGAFVLSHRICAEEATAQMVDEFRRLTPLRSSYGDLAGAHVFDLSEMPSQTDLLRKDPRCNEGAPDVYYSGTIRCLSWEGKRQEVAIHDGAFYLVDNKSGTHTMIQRLEYLDSRRSPYVCAYLHGTFYHAPKGKEQQYFTALEIRHFDWNGHPVITRVARL